MTHDAEVRPVLRAALEAAHPGVLVIEELGLDYGAVRADIAVVNGCIHGYEIKAEADTLTRLRGQAKVYNRALDRVTLVAAPRHLAAAFARIPAWWGIWSIEGGGFVEARPSEPNPDLDLRCHAMLLWRDEAAALLEAHTRTRTPARMTKGRIQDVLIARLSPDDLRRGVREFITKRGDWRARGPEASGSERGTR